MKKIATLVLAAAVGVVGISACGGPSETETACVTAAKTSNQFMNAAATGDYVTGLESMTKYHNDMQACFDKAGIDDHVPTLQELGNAGSDDTGF